MNLWETVQKCEFTFEMLLLSFLLCRNFVKRRYFWLWAAAGSAVCFAGTVLMMRAAKTMWQSIPCILLVFLLSMLTLLLCYESPVRKILFVSVTAYIAQSILYSVFIIFQTLFSIDGGPGFICLYAALLCMALVLLEKLLGKRLEKADRATVHPGFLSFLFLTAALIDIVFKFYMVDHQLGKEAGGVFVAWKGFSMVSCLLLLVVQFGALYRNSILAEKEKLSELLYQKQQQYEISRENMELINMKCHDLKHWFQGLSGSAFEKEAGEIQKALAIYDSLFQTGNEILDTILTEKKLYCEYNKIHMTCIAEGQKLDFLSQGEICSLFGNLVDNAVTAVSKITDEEKRTIHLSVRSRGRLLSIHEENYFEGELIQKEDGFETTKTDKVHHGFGLKSIRMITENHYGSMTVTAENGIFNINLLIPLPEE